MEYGPNTYYLRLSKRPLNVLLFQTTYHNKCNPVYTKKCNAVPRKECKTTYWNKCEKNQVCKTNYTKKCTKVPNKTCKTVQDKKCHQIPKKECQTKYTKKCKSTPKKNCKTVYQQKCTKQPVQNCKNEQVTQNFYFPVNDLSYTTFKSSYKYQGAWLLGIYQISILSNDINRCATQLIRRNANRRTTTSNLARAFPSKSVDTRRNAQPGKAFVGICEKMTIQFRGWCCCFSEIMWVFSLVQNRKLCVFVLLLISVFQLQGKLQRYPKTGVSHYLRQKMQRHSSWGKVVFFSFYIDCTSWIICRNVTQPILSSVSPSQNNFVRWGNIG